VVICLERAADLHVAQLMPLALTVSCFRRRKQSINIRLLRHDKMQANNSKQKGNAVSKKKACLDNKPKN